MSNLNTDTLYSDNSCSENSKLRSQLHVAAIQMVSGADLAHNLVAAEALIDKACRAGAELIVLPEYFAIMSMKEKDKLLAVELHGEGRVQAFLSSQAKKHKAWIVGGTHPIASDIPTRPYARCYVFSPEGQCVCWYDKIHMFDVTVKDKQQQYCESRFSYPGTTPVTFKSPWGNVGLSVCYDIRFPELFRHFAAKNVNLIVLPAAFTYETGKAHWDILLKARAIENLTFVIASAQGGRHQNGRETWGHSSIVSPWGDIIAQTDFGEGIASAKLNFADQKKIRNEFPALNHRRL